MNYHRKMMDFDENIKDDDESLSPVLDPLPDKVNTTFTIPDKDLSFLEKSLNHNKSRTFSLPKLDLSKAKEI